MSDNTKIEWADATWNPIAGCTKVSEGCRNCYAERQAASGRLQQYAKYQGTIQDGHWTGKVNLDEEALEQPYHWKKPRKIFVNGMSDLFHPAVPDEWIDKIIRVVWQNPRHVFQILTKRLERMNAWFTEPFSPKPPPNLWLGVSVENQQAADERIPLLLQTPAAVRFLSVEPMLGPVDLKQWLLRDRYFLAKCPKCGFIGTSEFLKPYPELRNAMGKGNPSAAQAYGAFWAVLREVTP